MKHEPAATAESRHTVLRDVVLQHQPHALLRPAVRPASHHPHASLQGTHAPQALAEPPEPRLTYEDGLTAGYEQGYAAGHAGAAQELRIEQEEAMREELRRATEEGLRDGYRKGLEKASGESQQALDQALREARAQQQECMHRLQALLSALPEQLQQRLSDVEDDILALCHDVICAMLGQASTTPAAIRAMVEHFRGEMRTQPQVTAHLHPEDWAMVQESVDSRDLPGIQWACDVQVELGGVLLRSPQGSIDARFEVQMETLRATLITVRSLRRAAHGMAQ